MNEQTENTLGLGQEESAIESIEENFDDLFGQPESYDYHEIELPEGMILDEMRTNQFSDYAKKLNLSQKGANNIVKMAVDLTEQTKRQTLDAFLNIQKEKIEGYKNALVCDREIGGNKLNSAIETANIAYDGFFADEELRSLIAESGLSVHPKFIKALKEIGENMKEDSVHSSLNSSYKPRNIEDILYPSMKDMP